MTPLIVTVDHEWSSVGGDPVLQGHKPALRFQEICEAFSVSPTWFPDVLAWMTVPEGELVREWLAGRELGLHLHLEHLGLSRCGDQHAWDSIMEQALKWLPEHPVAFRAGGWQAEPGGDLLRALRQNQIWIESSVMPGRWARGRYDHRQAPSGWWQCGRSVLERGDSGVFEFPISTATVSPFLEVLGSLRRGRVGTSALSVASAGSRFFNLGHVHLDVCTRSLPLLKHICRKWRRQNPNTPVVLSAHTQNFDERAQRRLQHFFRWALHHGFQARTYPQTLEALRG